jgi:hypothetical protein
MNTKKTTNRYNRANNIISGIAQRWVNNSWFNTQKKTYTYENSTQLITTIQQTWSSVNWLNRDKTIFSYDKSGNLLSQVKQKWSNKVWVNFRRERYRYNASSYIIEGISEKWGSRSWLRNNGALYFKDSMERMFYFTGYKINITYRGTVDVEDRHEAEKLTIWPNPAAEMIYVKSDNMPVNITIFNSGGMAVKSIANISNADNTYKIDVSSLPSGVYLLNYRDRKGVRIVPFVIAK